MRDIFTLFLFTLIFYYIIEYLCNCLTTEINNSKVKKLIEGLDSMEDIITKEKKLQEEISSDSTTKIAIVIGGFVSIVALSILGIVLYNKYAGTGTDAGTGADAGTGTGADAGTGKAQQTPSVRKDLNPIVIGTENVITSR